MEQRMMRASREQIVAIMRQRAERHRENFPVAEVMGEAGMLNFGQPLVGLPFAGNDFLIRGFAGLGGGAAGAVGAVPLPGANAPGGGGVRVELVGNNGPDVIMEGMRPFVRHHQQQRAPAIFRQATVEDEEAPKMLNVACDGEILSHNGEHNDKPGCYISGKPLNYEKNYFEIEIVDKSSDISGISIGLVGRHHPPDVKIGHKLDTVSYHVGEGNIYKGNPRGQPFGPVCDVGDKIGCGIRPVPSPASRKGAVGDPEALFHAYMGLSNMSVFFTKNGKEIGNVLIPEPYGGSGRCYPAISLQGSGDEVVLHTDLCWAPDEESVMLVDSVEDEWERFHNVRLNGNILEYNGRGKSLVDVGLAQARNPIGTRNHYFEMEIVDPGLNCYIAIGLAHKDYPKNRHPGWNKGSIAYHADDGKIFVGNGAGSPFGPRCHKGDIMGCGVLFPRNYECKSDSEEELEQQGGSDQYGSGLEDLNSDFGQLDYVSDSGDEDEWWKERKYIQSGVQVQIYFTRNGKVIGKKEAQIPKGGFYPTIGMMSCDEKVRVDLRPLSG